MHRITSFVWVEIAAVLGLLLAGAALTWIEGNQYYGNTFFTYRLRILGHLPAWFAEVLLLMVINGVWLFRLASLEGVFLTPSRSGRGRWHASLPLNPLRLFAVNLVAIPVALFLFVAARASYL